ncbi:MAG TPA: SDR family NAD(P)-dependent oxidoreductase [Terriglobales bacterium]|nr:SDR family NAD(P)-dependent oxidoreductase [Terriglobales bacterium]
MAAAQQLKFASEGADLVLGARRNKLLKQVAAECEKNGVRALTVECDVSDQDDVDALAEAALDEFGRFDVWVNNAGVAAYGEFDRVPMKEHEQVIETNLLGTMYGSYAALKHFYERGEGTLINISSFVGEASAPYHSSYVASKHAIRGLDMSLRQELEAKKLDSIHVCTVMPTSHDTPFFEHAANHTGKPVRPTPPVYDPQRTIDAIVDLAINPQDEVTVGTAAKAGSILNKVARGAMERRMAKKVHELHFGQEQTARDSSGSLFKPMASGDDVRGGWLEKEGGHTAAKVAAAAAIPLALAVLGVLQRRTMGSRESGRAA